MGTILSKSQLPQQDLTLDPTIQLYIDLIFAGNFSEALKKQKSLPNTHPQVRLILFKFKSLLQHKNDQQLETFTQIHKNNQQFLPTSQFQDIQTFPDNFDKLKLEALNIQKKSNLNLQQTSPKLHYFINSHWLGENILAAWIQMKKPKKHHNYYLRPKTNGLIDTEVFAIVPKFMNLMIVMRSFVNIRRIFDSDLDMECLTDPITSEKYYESFDNFWPESANRFRDDLINICRNVLQVLKNFKELNQKYLSKQNLVKNLDKNEQKDFEIIVSRISEIFKNKLSQRKGGQNFKDEAKNEAKDETKEKKKEEEEQIFQIEYEFPGKRQSSSELKRLEKQNENLKKENREINQKGYEKDNQIFSLKKQIEQLKKPELPNKPAPIPELLIQRRAEPSAETIKAELKKDFDAEIEKISKRLEDQCKQKLKIANTGFQQQLSNINAENAKKIAKMQESLQQSNQEILKLVNEGKKISIPVKNKQSTLQDLQNQLEKTMKQITSEVKAHFKNNQQTIDGLQSKIYNIHKTHANEKSNFQQQIQQLIAKNQNSIKGLSENQKKAIKDIEKLQNTIKKLQENQQKAIKDIEKLKKTNQNLKEEISKVTELLEGEKRQKKKLDKQFLDLELQYKDQAQDIQKMTIQLKNSARCYTQYFNSHILNINNADHLQWFVQNLEQSTGKTIRATYPLYRFDKENKTSFHHYIDNKPQIVIIIKMKTTGQIIAGYSEAPFKPKTNIDYRQGFMFGIKNKRIFTLKKEPTNKFNKVIPRPVTYDEYFLMWGNSDIKIKSGTDELFSVYATPNCCYEERGNEDSKVDDIFLQDERETLLDDYELFQVEFENGENVF